jgi:hypothetical protein
MVNGHCIGEGDGGDFGGGDYGGEVLNGENEAELGNGGGDSNGENSASGDCDNNLLHPPKAGSCPALDLSAYIISSDHHKRLDRDFPIPASEARDVAGLRLDPKMHYLKAEQRFNARRHSYTCVATMFDLDPDIVDMGVLPPRGRRHSDVPRMGIRLRLATLPLLAEETECAGAATQGQIT